jgi:hypothetical protein
MVELGHIYVNRIRQAVISSKPYTGSSSETGGKLQTDLTQIIQTRSTMMMMKMTAPAIPPAM